MPEFDSTLEYRSVVGFPRYKVGNDGSAWVSRPSGWKRLSQRKTRDGYLRIVLHPGSNYRQVHRLVLEAFVGPCPEGMEACHDPDPCPANNALSNLRWDTRKANMADCIRHGRMPRGVHRAFSKLTDDIVRAIRSEYLAGGLSMQRLGRKYGVSPNVILWIVHRKTWAHVV